MRAISRLLSILFHPLFMPLISVFVLFQLPVLINYRLSAFYKIYIYATLTINLIVAPILISIYLKRKGIIQSIEMKTPKERRIPFLLTLILYLLTSAMLFYIRFPIPFLKVFLAANFVVFVLCLLAFFGQKLSAHLSGLGGLCGMLFIMNLSFQIDLAFLLIIAIVVSGMVASARMALKAHSIGEITGGFIIGFISQYIAFLPLFSL